MKNKFIFIAIVITLTSIIGCRHKSFQDNVNEKVTAWIDKTIVVPDFKVVTMQGHKLPAYNFGAEYRLITVVDSLGCMSCKMQLKQWNDYLSQIQARLEDPDDVDLLYIVESELTDDILKAIQLYDYRRPIILDPKGTFAKANSIPKETEFRTFLVDHDNKVLAIGNPFIFPEIGTLYASLIGVHDSIVVSNPTIEILPPKVSLGVIEPNRDITARVTLKNCSDSMLHIDSIYTSCSCIAPTLRARVIRPKGEIEMIIRYTSESEPIVESIIYRRVYLKVRELTDDITIDVVGYRDNG